MNILAYFGPVFGCSFLTWFSVFLVRSSTNFAKKIQEFAEDKAENPRTCRGQSREKNPYERLQENSNPSKLCSSKLPSLSQPSLLQKLWAAVLPPRGGFNPPPYGVGVLNGTTRSSYPSVYPPSGFFFSEVLVFPLLNPPPVASGRLHLLRRSAALARLGASWAEKVAFQEAFKN